jgi:dTDP-3-amino-3,4,6-trideoxy-alpha-D-glucopyranose N,N-dimethyltransferase
MLKEPSRTSESQSEGELMYGAELAKVYETLYRSRGKDWSAEAAYLAELIRDRFPAAQSLLDVACGTGAHLERFGELFGHVEGLEYSADMLAVAERRLPDGTPLHMGDMREFDLGRTFEAVSCMFTAISYVGGLADMRAAVRCMVEHLVPGGVLVIEPWWFPEKFLPGYVAGEVVREDGQTIARVSHSTLQDNVTRLEVRYLVGTSAGITQFTEVDYLSLFTKDEYLAAFTDAGCAAEFIEPDPEGKDVIIPRGRGLFIGTRAT